MIGEVLSSSKNEGEGKRRGKVNGNQFGYKGKP